MKKALFFGLTLFTSLFLLTFAFSVDVFADDGTKIDTGDTAFLTLSTVLVFLMTPALAFFYGGMVRRKNVLNTLMSTFAIIAIISIQWVLFGYSLAFGSDKYGIIGSFDFLGLSNVSGSPNPDYAATIPHLSFVMFQLMFAIITPALILGSVAERIKFSVFMIFVILWSTLVYDPLAHWVWGVGGWLRNLGALDFAGGTVVHISSGVAGLVAALVIGPRAGFMKKPFVPHNIPFVLMGAGLLWFGWFGFNAGSALAMNELALNAFVTTNTSASAALVSWIIIEKFHRGKPTLLGAATGCVVGLVAITPAAGFVTPLSAILIGLFVSPLSYFFITFVKEKLRYDDSLDAFGCHGIGGIWGAIATGLFATKNVNPAGNDGLFYGNPGLLGIQTISVLVTIVLSAVFTFLILKIISIFTNLRAETQEEEEGLDVCQHGEDAYPDFSLDYRNVTDTSIY